jgi:hypothetical protein
MDDVETLKKEEAILVISNLSFLTIAAEIKTNSFQ